MAVVLHFSIPFRKGWSQAELAEFARIIAILRRTGLPVSSEFGLSDEDDPWVIFLRDDTGDVIAHVARIDGQIVATSAAMAEVVVGQNFRVVMDRIARSQPLVLSPTSSNDRVLLHPSAVIVAFIATAIAWSLEDDAKPYAHQWTIDAEGKIALVPHAKDGVNLAGFLRDAVMSKAEAGRLGLSAESHDLSAAFAITAGLAAVMIAARGAEDSLLGEDGLGVMLSSDSIHYASAVQQIPAAPLALDKSDGDFGSSKDHADVAEHDHLDVAQHVPATFQETPKAISEPKQGERAADAPPPAMEKASVLGSDLPGAKQMSFGPEIEAHHDAAISTPAMATNGHMDVIVSENASSSAPATYNSSVSAPHVVALSSDATELLSLLFSSKLPFAFSSVSSGGATYVLEGPVVAANIDGAPGINVANADHSISSSTPTPDTAATTAPTGFQLVQDILAFAADGSHELAASTGVVQALQKALSDQPFLPAADRVLIIDVPDLQAQIFKFADGLTVMSQDTAAKLLPSVDMHVQEHFALSNGTTLSLIGVIDLHQTLSS